MKDINIYPIKIEDKYGNDKYGYIDKKGKIVIKPKFKDAQEFLEGLAAVGIEDESGYIDIRGEIVIELKFDDASDFSEGLAKVEFGSAYIDKTGRYIWNPFKEKEEEIPVPEIPAEENRLSIYFSTLEKIYSKHGSFLGAGEEESRKIGQKINASHGFDGMVYVCESIRDELGQVAYRQLEAAWDGIGKWRG